VRTPIDQRQQGAPVSRADAARASGRAAGARGDRVSSGLLLVLPANLLILLVIVFPFLYVFGLSFYNEAEGEYVGAANYRALLDATDFWPSVRVSLAWTAGNLVLQTLGGLGLALLLHRRFAGRDAVRTLFLVPFVVPTAVVALMWGWILNSTFGVLNHVLLETGLRAMPINFLGDPNYALPTLVLINVWRWIPLVALIIFAILQGIPRSEYEAARVEGAGAWASFRFVTYPYLGRSMTALGLLGTLLTFNIFDLIWLLTAGGPLNKTKSLPVYIYEIAFGRQNLGGAAAASVVMFLLLVAFTVLYFRRREFRTAA
jgi:multiple sugar transport system permease protein